MGKTKILYIIKTMDIGGAERIVYELSKHLVFKYDITILSSGGIFCDELEKFGIKCINRNINNYNTPLKLFKIYKNIKEVISSDSFQIIHTHHRILQFLVQIYIGKNKSVYTSHNFFVDFKQFFLFPKILISCSTYVNDFSRDLISKNTIRLVINNGINKITKSMAPLTQIVYIGRFTKEKGIFNLLKAFELLKKSEHPFKLKLVGRQDSTINIALLKSLKLENDVTFYKPTIDLKYIYYNSGILVLPSEVPEGLPISILEAMANNVLVVSTNIGGISEILNDKITGFVLRNSEPETIAIKIEEIIKNYSDNKIKRIKYNAAQIVNKNYSLKKMIEEYDKVYSKILEV